MSEPKEIAKTMEKKPNSLALNMTTTAIMTAVLCVLAPISIPIGPVPISLTNLVIYVFMYVLDAKRGTIAYLIYLLLGLVGLPVFSGYEAGAGKLFGPTGGYLIGLIPMVFLLGSWLKKHYTRKISDRILSVIVMEAITWIPYLIGTWWLAVSSTKLAGNFAAALALGVTPFIIEDLIKMIIAALAGPELHERLKRFI